jgi:aryl-alcohol dehydrogenase-like predicted oxidoreductase
MYYLTIPGLATPLSRIALGTASFSSDDYAQAAGLLDAFVELGGTCIDTAHVYGHGASERAIGRWLAERHNRADVVLIDKGCHPIGGSGPRVTPQAIYADLTESLERLQTDSIDLYLLHRDDERVAVDSLIEALNEECAAGRVRVFGASNWRIERIVAANVYAAQHGLAGFVVSSPNLSLARPKEPMWVGCISLTDADRAWHTAAQFPVVAWSSQAGGFLSGRFSRDDTSNADMLRVWYSDENFERLRRATELGRQKGTGSMSIALAYVLSQPFPTVALVGPATVAELHDSCRALAIDLTADEVAYLDLTWKMKNGG